MKSMFFLRTRIFLREPRIVKREGRERVIKGELTFAVSHQAGCEIKIL